MIRMREERELRGMSRAALSRKADLNAATVGQIESGRFWPYPSQLAKIARALDWEGVPEALLENVTEDAGDSPARVLEVDQP